MRIGFKIRNTKSVIVDGVELHSFEKIPDDDERTPEYEKSLMLTKKIIEGNLFGNQSILTKL